MVMVSLLMALSDLPIHRDDTYRSSTVHLRTFDGQMSALVSWNGSAAEMTRHLGLRLGISIMH